MSRRLLALLAAPALISLALPVGVLLARAPWTRAGAELGRPEVLAALGLSLRVSLGAVGLALLGGAPLAWWLARSRSRSRSVVRALVTLPLVLPPVVAGTALLAAFGRSGWPGGALVAAGIELPFSTAGAVVAAAFVAAPLLVQTLEAGLARVEPRRARTAAVLGASPRRVLLHVILPEIRPALLAGIGLCWARALGEFGATIAFAGNLPGRTQTLPLLIYEQLHVDVEHAWLLAGLLVAISGLTLAALHLRGETR